MTKTDEQRKPLSALSFRRSCPVGETLGFVLMIRRSQVRVLPGPSATTSRRAGSPMLPVTPEIYRAAGSDDSQRGAETALPG